jgi:hypothetical protein
MQKLGVLTLLFEKKMQVLYSKHADHHYSEIFIPSKKLETKCRYHPFSLKERNIQHHEDYFVR